MLQSYLLAAYQHFMRYKLFTVINMLGLAIGFCVFTLISQYVKNEYSYDKHWKKADQIYLLTNDFKLNEQLSIKTRSVAYPATPSLLEYFPDAFEHSSRRLLRGDYILVGDKQFHNSIFLIEKDFLEIFNIEVLSGSLNNTLANIGNIALSEELAHRYFGTSSAIGETISLNVPGLGLVDYQISATYKLPPGNTSLTLPAFSLLNESAIPEFAGTLTQWNGAQWVEHFFRLNDGVDIDRLNQQLDGFVNQHVKEPWRNLNEDTQMSDFHHYNFQQYSEIHFDSELLGQQAGDKSKTLIFAIIGVLVLIIGSANFVILTTAKAEERRREVGIRKVLGANRRQLVLQFVGESVLFCLLALLASLLLTTLFSPYFSSLTARDLPTNIFTFDRIALLCNVSIFVGVLGGLYPAFVLANFEAVKIFKPFAKPSIFTSINLRSLLVTFQFCIAITLIITSLVLYVQLSFFQNRPPGFNPENVLTINLNNTEQRKNITPLINEIQRLAGVKKTALSTMPPNRRGMSMFNAGEYTTEKSSDQMSGFSSFSVGYDFFSTYEIPLLAGRSFNSLLDPLPPSPDTESTPSEEQSDESENISKIVINRFLSSSLGFSSPEEAIGKLIYQKAIGADGDSYQAIEIIGVVEDSHFLSLREKKKEKVFYSIPIMRRLSQCALMNLPPALFATTLNLLGKVFKVTLHLLQTLCLKILS